MSPKKVLNTLSVKVLILAIVGIALERIQND